MVEEVEAVQEVEAVEEGEVEAAVAAVQLAVQLLTEEQTDEEPMETENGRRRGNEAGTKRETQGGTVEVTGHRDSLVDLEVDVGLVAVATLETDAAEVMEGETNAAAAGRA